MLALDPIRRDLNGYRYGDNDPVDYADPTGEVLNIIGGTVQGGLVASGAGIPMALASNFLAGTAGSAAEQYISEGKVDARKCITRGLTNAVCNAMYGTRPLGSVGEAFLRGAGAGAATAGINYISDLIGQKPGWKGIGAGPLTGLAGGLILPYVGAMWDPRSGCGSVSPFVPIFGYSSAKGYQYSVTQAGDAGQEQKKKFSLREFLKETAVGGITGGVASAGFYGAGKGIEKLTDSIRNVRNRWGNKGVSNPEPALKYNLQFFAGEGGSGTLNNGIPNNPKTVRRFMSKQEYKQFKKKGFIFNPNDSRGGNSSTSTKIKPNSPDMIKKVQVHWERTIM